MRSERGRGGDAGSARRRRAKRADAVPSVSGQSGKVGRTRGPGCQRRGGERSEPTRARSAQRGASRRSRRVTTQRAQSELVTRERAGRANERHRRLVDARSAFAMSPQQWSTWLASGQGSVSEQAGSADRPPSRVRLAEGVGEAGAEATVGAQGSDAAGGRPRSGKAGGPVRRPGRGSCSSPGRVSDPGQACENRRIDTFINSPSPIIVVNTELPP